MKVSATTEVQIVVTPTIVPVTTSEGISIT